MLLNTGGFHCEAVQHQTTTCTTDLFSPIPAFPRAPQAVEKSKPLCAAASLRSTGSAFCLWCSFPAVSLTDMCWAPAREGSRASAEQKQQRSSVFPASSLGFSPLTPAANWVLQSCTHLLISPCFCTRGGRGREGGREPSSSHCWRETFQTTPAWIQPLDGGTQNLPDCPTRMSSSFPNSLRSASDFFIYLFPFFLSSMRAVQRPAW